MTQHTEVEWKLFHDMLGRGEYLVICEAKSQRIICHIDLPMDDNERVSVWKEARLIAASPKLLEALERLMRTTINQSDEDLAKAAIAKAKGE